MLSQAERQERITRIERLPSQLEALVAGLNDEQLDTPYGEGKWTIRQVVHHLPDSHLNAFLRTRLILTEDEPRLVVYDQDRWAKLPDSSTMPIDASMGILHGLHARWTFLFQHLSESDWSRKGDHPEWGMVSLDDMVTNYANHGESHMESIRKLRESKGW